MNTTHTPGPWRFMTDSTGEYLAVFATPQGGTKVICPVKIADEADARLIAKAPEMYAVLKQIASSATPHVDLASAIKNAFRLLAEIEGGK